MGRTISCPAKPFLYAAKSPNVLPSVKILAHALFLFCSAVRRRLIKFLGEIVHTHTQNGESQYFCWPKAAITPKLARRNLLARRGRKM